MKKTDKGTIEIYCDAKGEWRWRRKARNGRQIDKSSEGYTRKHSVKRAMRRQGVVVKGWEIVELG